MVTSWFRLDGSVIQDCPESREASLGPASQSYQFHGLTASQSERLRRHGRRCLDQDPPEIGQPQVPDLPTQQLERRDWRISQVFYEILVEIL